jgi:pimeloyl-ACP methyl ester carboxylesterase
MKSIVAGLATEHAENGIGPVVLMLHGWGDSLHSFDALVQKLPGFRIVRLDMPGFGNTELPKDTWTVEQYAKFVAEFCKKTGVQPEYVIGHSFGGRVIIKAVSQRFLEPKKIVFIASAGVADRQNVHNMAFTAGAKIGKALLKPFPKSLYLRLRKELYRVTGGDYISAGALQETFLAVIKEDLSSDAAHIDRPALLVWGEDDIVTPVEEGKKIHRLIKGSELKVLSGAGHFVHQQKADEVAKLIQEFFI